MHWPTWKRRKRTDGPQSAITAHFRRVYMQITLLLMVSTVILLLVMGFVYWRLAAQLSQDDKTNLSNEVQEIQDLVDNVQSRQNQWIETFEVSDELGQHVFFSILENGRMVLHSLNSPLPASVLRTDKPGYTLLYYRDHPYRVLMKNWSTPGHAYQLFLYHPVVQESNTLLYLRNLMFIVGGVGVAGTIVLNLWVAARALGPARRIWFAQQQMMLELSHELQTPLATIQAIASSRNLPNAERLALTTEVTSATQLVSDVLYLAKLRAALPGQTPEPVAVSDVTEEMIERMMPLATHLNIELAGTAEAGLFVETTLERWSRLLSTLLKNVVDHAEPGTVATWTLEGSPNQVVFKVQNAVQQRERQHPQKTAGGLGISIARRLAEDMHGGLELERADGYVTATVSVPRLNP